MSRLIFMTRRLKKIASGLAIFTISSLILLVLLELAARILLPGPQFDTRLPLYPYVEQEREIVLPGIAPQSRYSTNRWGFRGDDPPEMWDATFTIITVGGSTTRDYYLDDTQTWSAILQEELRQTVPDVWVGNAGLDGHSTRGHLILMDEVIRQVHPDVVVLLVGVNDLSISFSETEVESYDLRTAHPLARSRLFSVLRIVKQIAFDGVFVVDDVGGYTDFEPAIAEPDIFTPLPDDLRAVLPSLPLYRDNLNQIIDLAEEMDIQLVILTQPALLDDTPYWETVWGKAYWVEEQSLQISGATFWQMLDIFNQTTLEVCAERDIICYDLASNIAHSEENFYDFVHFTEMGSRRVGEQVAHVIASEVME
jgi:lysophospholipase L1-like esterase